MDLFNADDAYCDMRLDLQPYLKQLRQMKRTLPMSACFQLEAVEERAVVGRYDGPEARVRGIFDLKNAGGQCGRRSARRHLHRPHHRPGGHRLRRRLRFGAGPGGHRLICPIGTKKQALHPGRIGEFNIDNSVTHGKIKSTLTGCLRPVRMTGPVRAGRRLRPPFLHGSVKEKDDLSYPETQKKRNAMAIPFQYESEYKRKLCTPDEAARVVKSGDWLDISMGCAFPSLMDAAIAKRKEELYGVKIRGYLIQQPIQMVECDPGREHFIYNSWHMSGYERKLCDRGMCSFNPMVFRNLGAYYQHFLTVNVAMMCVTPMNQHGYFNFSLSNASARAVLDKADIVILEINENLPWVYGGLDECIHIDDVDMIVEGPHNPLPSIQTPPASEAETRIAEFVVENMDDGATPAAGHRLAAQRRGPDAGPVRSAGSGHPHGNAVRLLSGYVPGRKDRPTSARTSTAIRACSALPSAPRICTTGCGRIPAW